MASICKICGNVKSCFTIEVPNDENEYTDEHQICGTCYDVIAEVSHRRNDIEIQLLTKAINNLMSRIEELELEKELS